MAATAYLLFYLALFARVLVFVSADEKVLKAEPRQNVTLPCRAPDKNPAIAVEWTKSDLRAEHVLLYRDEQFDIDDQHPSFKNRVDLQDRQMKDGDVSLILNNVTINDTGTYKCHVFMRGSKTDHISIIHLHVVPPGQTGGDKQDGSVGLIVTLVVIAVILVVGVVGYVIYRKRKEQQKQDSYQSANELQVT
ncbi:programmed cell death 1 ligand 1-like [Neolamprologus brichardi]|uniref:programmed cell death 1 ligand 1-like n=1 Tax=Neolamprologus brichardi TaxID=32507 RepID=UPI001643C3CD|nr:programmed cell death 1 ligand 1-like [Neolamprologus brichardi]